MTIDSSTPPHHSNYFAVDVRALVFTYSASAICLDLGDNNFNLMPSHFNLPIKASII
ncbi:hypothetical protein [Thioclava electrotropha]|uniref:hypothetical protein n=1 Tax=Thioclava electrotropha TaxID=1549850 RepID=UPI0023A79FAE|nr:hypothetical protein [Thioclava electrotropha]